MVVKVEVVQLFFAPWRNLWILLFLQSKVPWFCTRTIGKKPKSSVVSSIFGPMVSPELAFQLDGSKCWFKTSILLGFTWFTTPASRCQSPLPSEKTSIGQWISLWGGGGRFQNILFFLLYFSKWCVLFSNFRSSFLCLCGWFARNSLPKLHPFDFNKYGKTRLASATFARFLNRG